jgi:hypothetical protein
MEFLEIENITMIKNSLMYHASIYTRRKKAKDKYIPRNLKTYDDQWEKSFVNNPLGFTLIS